MTIWTKKLEELRKCKITSVWPMLESYILDESMSPSAFVLRTSVQPEAVGQLKITNDNSEYRERALVEKDKDKGDALMPFEGGFTFD